MNWPTRGLPLFRQSFATLATCLFLKGEGIGVEKEILFGVWSIGFIVDLDKIHFHEVRLVGKSSLIRGIS